MEQVMAGCQRIGASGIQAHESGFRCRGQTGPSGQRRWVNHNFLHADRARSEILRWILGIRHRNDLVVVVRILGRKLVLISIISSSSKSVYVRSLADCTGIVNKLLQRKLCKLTKTQDRNDPEQQLPGPGTRPMQQAAIPSLD